MQVGRLQVRVLPSTLWRMLMALKIWLTSIFLIYLVGSLKKTTSSNAADNWCSVILVLLSVVFWSSIFWMTWTL